MTNNKDRLQAYLLILLGCLIGGAAYPTFIVPHNIAPGGLTGIAAIFNYLFHWPVGISSLVMNIPLYILSWKTMGRVFAFRSLVATFVFSLSIDYLPLPPLTEDPMLAGIFGGVVLGIGLGLIQRGGATTGGTDMIARLVHHHFSVLSVGFILFLADCAVILCAAFTMNLEIALYSLICIFVSAKALDVVILGLGNSKACYIISESADDISKRILHEMDRGVTRLEGIGEYSGETRSVLLCVIASRETMHMKRIVREVDPRAFMFVTDTHEAVGEGFHNWND